MRHKITLSSIFLLFGVFFVWVRNGVTQKTLNRKGDLTFINYAKPLLNRILVDEASIVEQSQVSSQDDCRAKCLGMEACKSYNFGLVSERRGHCEILSEHRFTSKGSLQLKAGYFHVGIQSICEQSPCGNDGKCIPVFEGDEEFTCNCSSTGFKGRTCTQSCIIFDFEHGLSEWLKTGTAFNNQPTFGDNPSARQREPSKHQGYWWIGGFEDRPTPSGSPGAVQSDHPQGSLTSPVFVIESRELNFLIGGGCNSDDVRVELLVEGVEVLRETGKCSETMEERSWNVDAYQQKTAQIRLVDNSSSSWGHINFDNLRETC